MQRENSQEGCSPRVGAKMGKKKEACARTKLDPKQRHESKVKLADGRLALPMDTLPLSAVEPLFRKNRDSARGPKVQQTEEVVRQLGIGLRTRIVTQELALFEDHDGNVYYGVQYEWETSECPLFVDTADPRNDLRGIKKYAASLLDKFRLPYVGRKYKRRDAHGVPIFYFWEVEGRLLWGEKKPAGVSAQITSFVDEVMRDRIVAQLADDGNAALSEVYEIPYALEFLELLSALESEGEVAFRSSRRDLPAPADAFDHGIGMGIEMGALLREWQIARDPHRGKAVLREQKAARNRPPPPKPVLKVRRTLVLELAREILASDPDLSKSEVARRIAKKHRLNVGTVRNVLGEIGEKLHEG